MVRLDRYDRKILEILQQHGDISNQELAERVGLSASPCSRRVRQLEDSGIIRQRAVLLNPEKLGLKLTAVIQISMDKHTPDRFERFESELEVCPEVISCSLITGQSADYLVEVMVPDMDKYQEFLLGTLTRIPGVTGVHSSFILRRVIDRTAIPLTYLPGA